MKWTTWSLMVAAAMAVSATLTGWGAFQFLVASHSVLPGVQVLEHRYDPQLYPEPGRWLEQRRAQLLDRSIYIKTPKKVVEYDFDELGLELDVAQTLRQLRALSRKGGQFEQVQRAVRARRGLLEQEASFAFDRERARATLQKLASEVYEPPVDARLDIENRRRVESSSGRALDIDATLNVIEAIRLDTTPIVQSQHTEVFPAITSDMIADIDVSKVLASFETSFRNKAGSRAVNIRKAAEYLDGTILAPGATLSFNQVVGPRVERRGFTEAPVIVNDEMEPGIGGGVCQVATTLHAAAVHGALQIEQRRSHSRPSGYAPLGLDATVIDGKVDLKLNNPYDTALMIHAYLPSRYTVRVEFLGREPPGKVKHVYVVTERHDFMRRVASKGFLEPGEYKRRQKGSFGYDVVSIVSLEHGDGKVSKHRYKSKYYPVPEVFWVAEGTDISQLPELPEGATHTEHIDDASLDVASEPEPDAALRG